MASIIKIGDKWRAQVRRKGCKPITKTHPTKAAATAWARGVEATLDAGGAVAQTAATTVAAMIKRYREMREESGREVLDTSNEWYILRRLEDGLGEKVAERLDTADLVAWCQLRMREGAGPSTINMDISKLGTVLRHAGSIMGLRLPDVLGMARPTLHHLRLIGGGGKRQRRPTADELARIFAYCRGHEAESQVWPVMEDIIRIAVVLGLRRGEIFRVRWDDLDEARRMLLVRDRKDPRKKQGNDQWVPLIGDSLEIIKRQPRVDGNPRIFPHHPQTVSKYFREACVELSIPDLHFHDMRHEAASVLEELGWPDRMKALVTGHKSRANMDRYINLDPSSVFGLPQPPGPKK